MTRLSLEEPPIAPVPGNAAPDRGVAARWLLNAAMLGTLLTVFDQGLVSGSRFLATTFVGRFAGKEQLGLYSLGFTLIMVLLTFQDALISAPYMVLGRRYEGDRARQFAGSILLHQVVLTVLGLLLALLGWGLSNMPQLGLHWADKFLHELTGMGPVFLAILFTLPFVLLRDFGRQFTFSRLEIRDALLMDSVVLAVQMAGLFGLVQMGVLSATWAHAAVGIACGAAVLFWFNKDWSRFLPGWRPSLSDWKVTWPFSRWVFGSLAIAAVGPVLVPWLLAFHDMHASGLFAACLSVILFSNPFVQGIQNFLAPNTTERVRQLGVRAAWPFVVRATLLLGLAMCIFCGAAFFFGEMLVTKIFGDDFSADQATIVLLSLSALAAACGRPAECGLWATEQPQLNFIASLLGTSVTIVLAILLLQGGSILGAAHALLWGNVVATVVRIGFCWRSIATCPR